MNSESDLCSWLDDVFRPDMIFVVVLTLQKEKKKKEEKSIIMFSLYTLEQP